MSKEDKIDYGGTIIKYNGETSFSKIENFLGENNYTSLRHLEEGKWKSNPTNGKNSLLELNPFSRKITIYYTSESGKKQSKDFVNNLKNHLGDKLKETEEIY